MTSNITIPLVLGFLLIFFFISSQVAANDFKENEVARKTNGVDNANLVDGGGYGYGGGYRGGYGFGGFPGDYGYGGFPNYGYGGFPRGGFPRWFCRLGCCYRNPYTGQCLRCCP
ncbi:keratin-associated protein 19-2 [Vigna radiata var. radiata]|uniref:Keratin-associated protein 19-2 n=1 Tax=Vigna radiata var. radiata TaxID=3916 RepID=A0A1S3UE59_VIGRR|nr:keratin-associated protein 19-2 [Vigna radiata var. radiata]